MSRKILLYVSVLIILCLGFSVTEVYAHDWYSQSCCASQHCHPISSCSEILENAKGVVWDGLQFTKDMIKPSQDTQCHVCTNQGMNGYYNPICIYVQQGS